MSALVPSQKTLKNITAGGITGGIEICITFPTEFVKTQLQLDDKVGAGKRYNGIADCVKKTVQAHGPFGLYRGLSVLLYGSVPKSAVRFGAYENVKRRVAPDGQITKSQAFCCGLFAGASEAVLAVTPMETVKVKFIDDRNSKNPRFKGFFHGVREIIKAEGIGGVYKGVVPTIMKQGSNQAIRFVTIESLRQWYRGDDKNKYIHPLLTGLFGGIAGAASVFGNTPIDVVKSRLQGLEAKKYRSTLHCFQCIWRDEGFRGFYKGTVPRLSRVCLDVAITFMIYDEVMKIMNQVWKV